jgi:hypothetical protein
MTKKRNKSKTTNATNIDNTGKEKVNTRAGIVAMMGITKLAMYRLLAENGPLARFGKASTLPGFAILLATRFKADIHRELSNL